MPLTSGQMGFELKLMSDQRNSVLSLGEGSWLHALLHAAFAEAHKNQVKNLREMVTRLLQESHKQAIVVESEKNVAVSFFK